VFTPSVPREDTSVAPPEADLAAAVREQLQALGIYARALTPAEKLARERLEATFVTVPTRERPTESDYEVADARVEYRAVLEVLRYADEIGLIGTGQSSLEEVARALEATYKAYQESATEEKTDVQVLATEYRAWLVANKGRDSDIVLNYLKTLRSTLRKIELLGLTRQELEGSKAQIYGSVLRAKLNIEPEFLRQLVDDSPLDDIWDIKVMPNKQPHVQTDDSPKDTATGGHAGY
jgi:hypothetical protein